MQRYIPCDNKEIAFAIQIPVQVQRTCEHECLQWLYDWTSSVNPVI